MDRSVFTFQSLQLQLLVINAYYSTVIFYVIFCVFIFGELLYTATGIGNRSTGQEFVHIKGLLLRSYR